MDEHHEEYERIPWSELNRAATPPRSRLAYGAAAVIAAVVVGVVAGRVMGGSDAPSPDAETTVVGEDVEVDGEATPSMPAEMADLSSLYSEADLMVARPENPELAAAARAEWFVTDYFTADMEPTGVADIQAALPAGAELPEMPQEQFDSLSYVEWARAFRVEKVSEELYQVSVIFRGLAAANDQGFMRLRPRAVAVTVAVSPEGGTVVVELPSPIPMPASPEPESWPVADGVVEAPNLVVEQASLLAAGWGDAPRLVEVQSIEGGWRIVLTVSDEAGNRWPLSLRLDDTGQRLG